MASDHDEIIEMGVKLDVLQDDVKDLESKVDKLTESLTKYKGVIGGIMLVFSLGGAAITLFLNYARAKV